MCKNHFKCSEHKDTQYGTVRAGYTLHNTPTREGTPTGSWPLSTRSNSRPVSAEPDDSVFGKLFGLESTVGHVDVRLHGCHAGNGGTVHLTLNGIHLASVSHVVDLQ